MSPNQNRSLAEPSRRSIRGAAPHLGPRRGRQPPSGVLVAVLGLAFMPRVPSMSTE